MAERRLRVLIVASHPVQYQAHVFRRMASREDLDLRVAYCSLRGAEPGLDPEFGATVQWDVPLLDGYDWTLVPNSGSGADTFLGTCNLKIWKLVRGNEFDAVISFVGYVRASFWIAYAAARSCGAVFIFGCDQGSLEPRDGRAWKRRVKRIGWPILYRLADQVVVSSTKALQLIRSLGIEADRITLTPLVVNNDWWTAKAEEVDRNAIRQTWNVSKTDFVVLFCAKLQDWKRPLDLLRAFARADLERVTLVFAGEGPLHQEIEKEAAALGVHDRIRFLGFVNQSTLPSVYSSADLMVLPSDYEPFAVVVNEAMCCGCPVIASDRVGAAYDLVAPVEPNFVFRCGDVEGLAALIRRAVFDADLVKDVGRRSKVHMRSWAPERNIVKTVEAIRCAISRTSIP